MGVAVLERDTQDLVDLCALAEQGDSEAGLRALAMCLEMTGRCTSWQWVIHGDTREFRRGAVAYLCRAGKFRKAMRFALCGRGDVVSMEVGGDAVKVSPRGCGCRFCPRCSRRSGQRFLRRIGAHLEARKHGEIWHFVLTQPVRVQESVGASRLRFEAAWKLWYRVLRSAGMSSALLTEHVKPRRAGGWHFHGHCIVEWAAGTDVSGVRGKLEVAWQRACKEESGREKELFGRQVCGEGEALVAGSFGGQGELWDEPGGAVQRVLQYAVRDVVQGCETWVGELTDSADVAAFAKVISDAKLHRLFGLWRKVVEGDEVEKENTWEVKSVEISGGKAGSKLVVWHPVGSMEAVFESARAGMTWATGALTRLHESHSNRGLVSRRLGVVVASVTGLRRAG